MSVLVSKGLGQVGHSAYPSCLAFLVTGVFPDVNRITVDLTAAFTASGPALIPASYVVTTPPGSKVVTVTGVSVVGSTLVLVTTPQSDGASYILNMPAVGLVDLNANPFNGPFANAFTGVGLGLAILVAYSVDVVTLDVVFNQPVQDTTALNPANYSISPTLTVSKSTKVSDAVYRLTTSDQTRDQVYTVTTSGVLPQ